MSGYDGFSRSNNAVAAEGNGRYPATTAAKILGCRVDAIERHAAARGGTR